MLRALPIFVAILLVRFFASEAQYQRARRLGGTTFFPPGLGLRLILGVGGPFLLYVTYQAVLEARATGEWWLPGLSGIFALGLILFRPPEIRINREGIHEVGGFLGLHRKTVAWNGGAAASFVPGLHEVLIVGRDGTTIKHRSYHVGQEQFLSELKSYNVFIQSR